MTTAALDALAGAALAAGRAAGLDAVGVASAEPFVQTRAILEERKAAGLHGGMHFTFGNPARSTEPERALAGARSLVVGAMSYLRRPPAEAAVTTHGGPLARVARYSWHDYYGPLREALAAVAGVLEAAGWRTRVLADDNALVDRAAARRAGIGWYGKNANLLLPGRGSWFVLGAVLTDAPLRASADDVVADGCGACNRCIPACPTDAIVAPGVIDSRRCLAWLLQAPGVFPRPFRAALGDRIYGCDECQEVCPPNRATARRDPPPPAESGDQVQVDVLGLLQATDDELLAQFGRWYIPRREPRYLRRNALVVLGNSGVDGHDRAVEATLQRTLADGDGLVRAHAVWAAARLGRTDLIPAADADPDVQAEIDALAGSTSTATATAAFEGHAGRA